MGEDNGLGYVYAIIGMVIVLFLILLFSNC